MGDFSGNETSSGTTLPLALCKREVVFVREKAPSQSLSGLAVQKIN
jgi:hypothetical protein